MNDTNDCDHDEAIANGRLIAEMLAALKDTLVFVAAFAGYYKAAYETGASIHPTHQEVLDRVSAVIAKAEGRQ